jgi:hypothetical protein
MGIPPIKEPAMSTEQTLGERFKAFLHLADEDDRPVRNHLAIRGSVGDVDRCLKAACASRDSGPTLTLDGAPIPILFEDSRFRETSGEWVTMLPGQAPERRTEHEEHAEAAFAFLTDEPMGGAVAHLSEEYPDLEVRYAWLRHHGEGRDTAEGGLWKAGNRIAKRHHEVEAVRADVQQLADLVSELETLET